jgi:riboflavin synthase
VGYFVGGLVVGVVVVGAGAAEHVYTRLSFRVPLALSRFIAPKGSVAVDGVSLTVNEVGADTFGVNIIPHTAAVTSFGLLRPGDRVNIEIDTLARYVARLRDMP